MHPALPGLAENPALPPDLVDRLITAADADLAEALADRPDLTHEQIRALSRYEAAAIRLAHNGKLTAADVDPDTRPRVTLALLEERTGRPEWAGRLAANPNIGIRQALAACPDLSNDVIQALAADPEVSVVAELALWAPSAVAAQLAIHPHAEVRRAAATNPSTPAEAVINLAAHPSMLLRPELAARPDLPSSTYTRLATDPIPWVRSTLAQNPAIDEDLIRVLAADRGYDVQRCLAHHPHIPLDVLEQLARVTRIGTTLLPRIATATPHEVEELATSPNATMRMLLAQRRDLPAHIRDALAADPDAKVLKSIAPHPGLSDAQLRAMLTRHGSRVAAHVAANPDATPELLEHLSQQNPPAAKALREIARHPNATPTALLACLTNHKVRPIAARHSALPPSAIVELINDESWQVAAAAAANPFLPLTVMAILVP
ncbi:MAG TPA: hypothetical protein VGX23_00570 [Actinocrinis sp.]|nr:hypothetical protein [Actinocrinis sp.]